MVYIEAVSKVLPVILLLLLGVFLNRTRFLCPETVQDFKKLIVNITLPSLLFLAFSGVNIQPHLLLIVGVIFLACLAVLLLGRSIQPLLGISSPYFPSLLTGFEAGMMGYAIFSAVYGPESIFKFGVIDLGQVTFVFFLLVPGLERLSMGPKPFRSVLVNFLKTPVILSIFLGIIFQQAGLRTLMEAWPITASLFETLAIVGSLTTPLVAIVIGYEMHLKRGLLAKPALAVGARMAIWIAFGLALNTFVVKGLLHLDTVFQAAVMTMFILPPPFVIPLFMPNADLQDRDFVLNTLTIATLATLIAFSIVSVIYPA